MRGWDEPISHVDFYGTKTRIETVYKDRVVVTFLYRSDEEVSDELIRQVEKNNIQIIQNELDDLYRE